MHGGDHDVRPEAAAVLADPPALLLVSPVAQRPFELVLRMSRGLLVRRVEGSEMPPDDLRSGVPLDPLRARVPARHHPFGREHENRVIPDGLDEQPEAFLAALQCLLRPTLGRDVLHLEEDVERPATRVADRGEREQRAPVDLRRESAAAWTARPRRPSARRTGFPRAPPSGGRPGPRGLGSTGPDGRSASSWPCRSPPRRTPRGTVRGARRARTGPASPPRRPRTRRRGRGARPVTRRPGVPRRARGAERTSRRTPRRPAGMPGPRVPARRSRCT